VYHSTPGLRVIKMKITYYRIRRGLDFFWIGSRESEDVFGSRESEDVFFV